MIQVQTAPDGSRQVGIGQDLAVSGTTYLELSGVIASFVRSYLDLSGKRNNRQSGRPAAVNRLRQPPSSTTVVNRRRQPPSSTAVVTSTMAVRKAHVTPLYLFLPVHP